MSLELKGLILDMSAYLNEKNARGRPPTDNSNKLNLSRIRTTALKKLASQHERLLSLRFPARQTIRLDLDRDDTAQLVKKTSSLNAKELTNIIYIISLPGAGTPIPPIQEAYSIWKQGLGKSVHSSMFNGGTGPHDGGPILYVGSKRSRFGSRIIQHVGTDNKQTYALHMKDWLPRGNRVIDVDYYCFGYTVDHATLQLIEDTIWDLCRPMLGKRGAH
jgi:hypothetical protein